MYSQAYVRAVCHHHGPGHCQLLIDACSTQDLLFVDENNSGLSVNPTLIPVHAALTSSVPAAFRFRDQQQQSSHVGASCNTSHLCTRVICYRVSTALAYTSAGLLESSLMCEITTKKLKFFCEKPYLMVHSPTTSSLTCSNASHKLTADVKATSHSSPALKSNVSISNRDTHAVVSAPPKYFEQASHEIGFLPSPSFDFLRAQLLPLSYWLGGCKAFVEIRKKNKVNWLWLAVSGETTTPDSSAVTLSLVHWRHLLPCQHCTCVHFRRALESQAKRCFHISHHIGLHRSAHCALTPHWSRSR